MSPVAAAAYRQSCDLPLSAEEQLLEDLNASTVDPTATMGTQVMAADILRLPPVLGTARLLCDLANLLPPGWNHLLTWISSGPEFALRLF